MHTHKSQISRRCYQWPEGLFEKIGYSQTEVDIADKAHAPGGWNRFDTYDQYVASLTANSIDGKPRNLTPCTHKSQTPVLVSWPEYGQEQQYFMCPGVSRIQCNE